MCFYKLVETSADVTARGFFSSIKNAFLAEEKDFYSYFKQNLVGYASDGEAVMSGKSNGLKAIFREEVKHPVFSIHCMAHRLELVIKKAFNKIAYFDTFEEVVANLHKFYNVKAGKRKAHLKETANIHKLKMYELKYIYNERWICSQLKAVRNINKMWQLLMIDLR